MAVTRRQREILDFIADFIAERGYSPSLEEIGSHFHLSSVATVHKHVERLVEKGLLRKSSHRSRSVEPVEAPAGGGSVSLPLVGTVAAGTPIEAIEEAETISVPRELAGRAESYALRVKGDSMIDEGIQDGDVVIVEHRPEARDGEVVVALVRGHEATLKRLQRRGPVVRLLPANPALRPIEVPAEDVIVRGVVRGLVRRYPGPRL